MLVPTMGGREQEVTFLIVQDHQRAAAQDFSCTPDQPTWEQRIGVDRLSVAINIKDGNKALVLWRLWLPEASGPVRQRCCEESIRSNGGQIRQKSFGVAVTVGEVATSKRCQGLTCITTEIPGSLQSYSFQKQQC